ncbi:salivary glue protein Sgs-5-like [Drosophila busckii]|uniref:salivary glue protein Sgs-5-like n=1 Tax=Drosophila busckii TaxID=30019 RepID=UPI00083F3A1F|nr:salivary glue protein Sgs-5-like [Drosophila busckii]
MFRVLFSLFAVAMCVVNATHPPTNCVCECSRDDRFPFWALKDFVCLPFHNQCFMQKQNDDRVANGQTPIIYVGANVCKPYIVKKCPNTKVIAEISMPPACGCPYKAGPIVNKTFDSLCHLNQYSIEQNLPYLGCWMQEDLSKCYLN